MPVWQGSFARVQFCISTILFISSCSWGVIFAIAKNCFFLSFFFSWVLSFWESSLEASSVGITTFAFFITLHAITKWNNWCRDLMSVTPLGRSCSSHLCKVPFKCSHHNHSKYLGREFSHEHCLSPGPALLQLYLALLWLTAPAMNYFAITTVSLDDDYHTCCVPRATVLRLAEDFFTGTYFCEREVSFVGCRKKNVKMAKLRKTQQISCNAAQVFQLRSF